MNESLEINKFIRYLFLIAGWSWVRRWQLFFNLKRRNRTFYILFEIFDVSKELCSVPSNPKNGSLFELIVLQMKTNWLIQNKEVLQRQCFATYVETTFWGCKGPAVRLAQPPMINISTLSRCINQLLRNHKENIVFCHLEQICSGANMTLSKACLCST